jgi:3-hydroxyisobutyrate dehydrogenase
MKKISFLGLGIMGNSIAKHLLHENSEIIVFNRNKKKSLLFKRKFKNKNVKVVDNPSEAASNSDFIFSCVGNDNDLKEIYFAKHGIINTIRPKTFIVDHTTVSADISIKCYDEFRKKGCFFLDAPVSGGEIGARDGKLSIMVGGDKKAFMKLKNLLGIYSKSLIYMGKSGNGQLAKMVNQICVAGVIQGLSEGLNFGKEKKLPLNSLIKAISNGAAQSWQMDNRASTMWQNKFNFGFMNKWMKKDLDIIINSASESKINIPNTLRIHKFYKKLIENGYEKYDTSSLIKLLKKNTND